MSKTFPALVGLSMLGLVGAANAAEPMALTEAQMDAVTAGAIVITPVSTATNTTEVTYTNGFITSISIRQTNDVGVVLSSTGNNNS